MTRIQKVRGCCKIRPAHLHRGAGEESGCDGWHCGYPLPGKQAPDSGVRSEGSGQHCQSGARRSRWYPGCGGVTARPLRKAALQPAAHSCRKIKEHKGFGFGPKKRSITHEHLHQALRRQDRPAPLTIWGRAGRHPRRPCQPRHSGPGCSGLLRHPHSHQSGWLLWLWQKPAFIITPWDTSLIHPIEHALLVSDIGINPTNDGRVIRLVFPCSHRRAPPPADQGRAEAGRGDQGCGAQCAP